MNVIVPSCCLAARTSGAIQLLLPEDQRHRDFPLIPPPGARSWSIRVLRVVGRAQVYSARACPFCGLDLQMVTVQRVPLTALPTEHVRAILDHPCECPKRFEAGRFCAAAAGGGKACVCRCHRPDVRRAHARRVST